MSKKNFLTIGADPEVFVLNTTMNEIISVEGLIRDENGRGTKENPLEFEKGFSLQEDNILAEYNIPPCKTKQEWLDAHEFGLATINLVLPDDCCYIIESYFEMDWLYLQSEQALVAGCQSDYNAYSLDVNPGVDLNKTNARCAGGHVHIGFNDLLEVNDDNIIKFVKALDLYLGIPSLLLDNDNKRRKLYGKAGCFRDKEFGLEYRVLSNFWLKTPELQEWVFDMVHLAYENMDNLPFDEELIELTINNNDLDSAHVIVENLNISKKYKNILV